MIAGYEVQNEVTIIYLKKIRNVKIEEVTLSYLQNEYKIKISNEEITSYTIKNNNSNIIGDIKIVSGTFEGKEKQTSEEIVIIKPKPVNFLGRERYLFVNEFIKQNLVEKDKVKYIPFKGEDYWNCSCGQTNFDNTTCLNCGLSKENVCSVKNEYSQEMHETNEKLKYSKSIVMWTTLGYIIFIFLQIIFGDFLLNNETKNSFFGVMNRFILPIILILSTIFEYYFLSKYDDKLQKILKIINYIIVMYFNLIMVIITLKVAYLFIFILIVDIVYGYTLIKNFTNSIVDNIYEKIIISICITLALVFTIKVSVYSKYDMNISDEGISLEVKTKSDNYAIPNTIDGVEVYKVLFDENYSYKIKTLHVNRNLKIISIKANNVLRDLETITIDEGSIMKVDDNVLYNYDGRILLVPKTVKSIKITDDVADYSVMYAQGLEEIYISKEVKYIGLQAFEGCENLKHIYFEKSSQLKEINDKAFYGCKSLEEFDCPISVEEIGDAVLSGCNMIKYVRVPFSGNKRENDPKNVFAMELFVRIFGGTADKDYNVVPSSLEEIEVYDIKVLHNGTFYGLKNVKEITLPKTMEFVGSNLFYNCKLLESFIIPTGIEIIGEGMFDGCESLTTIYIPSTVKVIETNAFRNCNKLVNVIIEGDISNIDIKEGNEVIKKE